MRLIQGGAVLASLVLAACGRAEPARQAPDAAVSAPGAGPSWTLASSGAAGTALVHSDAAGREVLRVACRRAPGDLLAAVAGIDRVGSEDRLTLGAGAELAVFVVSMEGPERGLRATGQPQPAFVAALAAGRDVGASYGSRQLTLPAPPSDLGAAFAARCADLRAASGG